MKENGKGGLLYTLSLLQLALFLTRSVRKPSRGAAKKHRSAFTCAEKKDPALDWMKINARCALFAAKQMYGVKKVIHSTFSSIHA